MLRRRWPGWLVASIILLPLVVIAYLVWSVWIAPLPTKDVSDMIGDLLDGQAEFSEALGTVGREERAAHVYLRFRTTQAGIDQIVGKLGLVASELTPAAIGAIRDDDRMPEWWQPKQELSPGRRWSGERDGWRYHLYYAPASDLAYMDWTML